MNTLTIIAGIYLLSALLAKQILVEVRKYKGDYLGGIFDLPKFENLLSSIPFLNTFFAVGCIIHYLWAVVIRFFVESFIKLLVWIWPEPDDEEAEN